MRPFPVSIVALVVAALLAGCGGGGGDESTESAPVSTEAPAALTKAELIERGDGICAEVNAALGTVGTSSSETGSAAEQEAGLYAGMIASLKNLGAPREAAGYPEFTAAAEALATAEDEVKLAAERGDATGLESAEASASSARSEFQTAAKEYGFEECGAGPSAVTAPESGETGSAEAPEEAAPEAVEPEAVPEATPETGGAGGEPEGGGTGGGAEGGGTTGGSSGGIGPG